MRLLEQECSQRRVGLLSVPGAPAGGTEAGLQSEEIFEKSAGSTPFAGRATASTNPCRWLLFGPATWLS
jgi:hypothetical protein